MQHAAFDPKVTRTGVQADSKIVERGAGDHPRFADARDKSTIYKVNIAATGKTSGDILVGFYLPGDASGRGR